MTTQFIQALTLITTISIAIAIACPLLVLALTAPLPKHV